MCFRQEKYFLNVLVQPFMPHTQWKFGSLRWHLPMWLSSCWKVTAKKVSHILQLQGIYAFVYRPTTEFNEKHWLKYLALLSALYRISCLCIYFRNSLYHAYLKLQHATFIATWVRHTCQPAWLVYTNEREWIFGGNYVDLKGRLVITLTFSFLTRSCTIQKCEVFSFAFEAKVKATALSERYIMQLKVSWSMFYHIVSSLVIVAMHYKMTYK